jgi:hypothetical protein
MSKADKQHLLLHVVHELDESGLDSVVEEPLEHLHKEEEYLCGTHEENEEEGNAP